jgi:Carbohydrate phosphorylase
MLIEHDHYEHIGDFGSYIAAQEVASKTSGNQTAWNTKAVPNVARMGKFSSDRTIEECARKSGVFTRCRRFSAAAAILMAAPLLRAKYLVPDPRG